MLGLGRGEYAIKLQRLQAERRDRHLARTLLEEAGRAEPGRPAVKWSQLSPNNRAVYLAVARRARAEIAAGR